MQKPSPVIILVPLLLSGSISAFAISRQSLIDIRLQIAPGREGRVIIDSRSTTQPPTLLPDRM
jgi:hypothetical protein